MIIIVINKILKLSPNYFNKKKLMRFQLKKSYVFKFFFFSIADSSEFGSSDKMNDGG